VFVFRSIKDDLYKTAFVSITAAWKTAGLDAVRFELMLNCCRHWNQIKSWL